MAAMFGGATSPGGSTPLAEAGSEVMPRPFHSKEFDRKRATDIVTRFHAEDTPTAALALWAARGLAAIASTSMTSRNPDALFDFLDCRSCELLVTLFTEYALYDEITTHAAAATAILAWSSPHVKDYLGEIGACEALVYALQFHIGELTVCEAGSAALLFLANSHIDNSFRLAEAGACDLLVQIGNLGFSMQAATTATQIAIHVCYGLAYLAEALNATKLLQCGAPGLVCTLSAAHNESRQLVPASVKATCALASLNDLHREELGRASACDQLVSMISRCFAAVGSGTGANVGVRSGDTVVSSVLLFREGCEAVMHLALIPSNSSRLGSAGAVELVTRLLDRTLIDIPLGTEICTGALTNLCSVGEDIIANRRRLLEANGPAILRRAQFSANASMKARENISYLLSVMEELSSPTPQESSATDDSCTHRVTTTLASEAVGSTLPLHAELVTTYDSSNSLAKNAVPIHNGSSKRIVFEV